MSRTRFLQQFLVAVTVFCVLLCAAPAWSQPPDVVPGSFICLVADSEDPFVIGQRAVEATGGSLGFVYTHALKGFSISVPPGIVVANLRAQPGIIHAEPDLIMHVCSTMTPTSRIPTGVDRINAEAAPVSDMGIAIIDTGIDRYHPDLTVVDGVRYFVEGNGPPWKRSVGSDLNYDDDNGHGTHCAGIAAADGAIVGVAPGASLYAVKVLDASGSGYMSAIAKGVDWVAERALSKSIAVANMSLGGWGESEVLYTAMSGCGVTFTVAAGNDGKDILGSTGTYGGGDDFIPAAYGDMLDNVLVISAMVDTDGQPGGSGDGTSAGSDDSFAGFSNYSAAGVIDYLLPGVMIESTYPGGAYEVMSGTSMAAPHAAGLVALHGASLPFWPQDSEDGLFVQNDPDSEHEPLGHAWYPGGSTTDFPPSVSITSPSDGTSVSGTVTITADASDDDAVTRVEFFVNDSSIGVGSGSSDDWSATWDTSSYGDGSYTLKATATDTAGQTADDTITVTLGEPTTVEMWVDTLSGEAVLKGKSGLWEVFVDVWVVDAEGYVVSGATVSGQWSDAFTGSVSGVTDSNGVVTFATGTMKSGTVVTFTIDNVVKAGYEYVTSGSEWISVKK